MITRGNYKRSVKSEMAKLFTNLGWTIYGADETGFGIQAGDTKGAVVVISEALSENAENWDNVRRSANQVIANKSLDFAIITNKYLFEVYKRGQHIGDLSIPPAPETAVCFH